MATLKLIHPVSIIPILNGCHSFESIKLFIFADQLSVNYIQYSHNCISMAFGIYILPFPLEILLPRYHCKTLLQVIGVKINKMWNYKSIEYEQANVITTFWAH